MKFWFCDGFFLGNWGGIVDFFAGCCPNKSLNNQGTLPVRMKPLGCRGTCSGSPIEIQKKALYRVVHHCTSFISLPSTDGS